MQKIVAVLPFVTIQLGPTYGLEYLRGKDRFVIHAFGNIQTGLIDNGGDIEFYHFLIDIENYNGKVVSINHLQNEFGMNDKNSVNINNTLVQSNLTDHLGLVLPHDLNASPLIPVSLFMTERYYQDIGDCMDTVQIFQEEKKVVSNIGVLDLYYDILEQTHYPYSISYPIIPDWNIKCQTVNDRSGANANYNLAKSFSVFPNPAKHELNFIIPELESENSRIEIYSIHGQLINQLDLKAAGEVAEQPVEFYAPGLYIATLIVSDQIQESIKFTIVR